MKKFLFGVNSIQGLECLKIAKSLEERGELKIVGVMSRKDRRWYDEYGWNCQQYAIDNDIELIDSIEDTEHDVFISILYDKILKQSEIDKARDYCLNFHIADATKYRGCYPLYHAIRNGEREYGVTCHKITTDIDKGDIYKIAKILIHEDDTAFSLNLRTVPITKQLFSEVVNKIVDDIPLAFYKNDTFRYYDHNSLVIPNKPSWNIIRALYFPPFEPYSKDIEGHKVYYIPENSWGMLVKSIKYKEVIK